MCVFQLEALFLLIKTGFLAKKHMKDSKSAKLLVYTHWAPKPPALFPHSEEVRRRTVQVWLNPKFFLLDFSTNWAILSSNVELNLLWCLFFVPNGLKKIFNKVSELFNFYDNVHYKACRWSGNNNWQKLFREGCILHRAPPIRQKHKKKIFCNIVLTTSNLAQHIYQMQNSLIWCK